MRKKRRNADEEMDKDDLPYPTGEPHAGTPVDIAGYQRMSAAYMSVSSAGSRLLVFSIAATNNVRI